MSHRVLVTAVGGNVGQGALKALRASAREFYVVGIDMEGRSAGFSLVDHYYRTPASGDPAFLDVLRAIVAEERLEAIYPCSPTELAFFARYQGELGRAGPAVFVNPPEVIRIGADKLLTAEFLRDRGFPSPQTVLATDAAGVRDLIARHGLPVIAKPRAGFSSRNVFLLESLEQVAAATALVPDLVLQQYLPDAGSECTAATVSGADGKVRAVIVLRRDLLQGTTYRTELVEDPALSAQMARISEALGAIGPCNLQFRVLDGAAYVFEINPRFSGCCGVRYLYGWNECEMTFDLLRLGLEVRQPVLRPGVVLRYWNEIHLPMASFADLRDGRVAHGGLQTILRRRDGETGATPGSPSK